MLKIFPYKLDTKTQFSSDKLSLNFVPEKGSVFNFKPGQWVFLYFYNNNGSLWGKLAFSVCSAPTNKVYIQLGIKVAGTFTQRMAKMKTGERVGISGPYGFFTFEEKKMRNTVFLAGGIGITPFMSMIRYIKDKKLKNKLTFIYSNRDKNDIAFYKELELLSQQSKDCRVIFTLTGKIPTLWRGEKGRINGRILRKYCFPYKEKYFFICGPLPFMEKMVKYLKHSGVSQDRIKIERFG